MDNRRKVRIVFVFSGWRANRSGKIADTHPIRSFCNLDFSVLPVIECTAKYPDTFLPADLLTGIPNARKAGLRLCGTPTVPLAGLARLARR
jgi:hypothetical protein